MRLQLFTPEIVLLFFLNSEIQQLISLAQRWQ